MGRLPCHALRFVGVASIAFACLGLWYNSHTLFSRFPPPNPPYFLPAFYTMSAICVGCYLVLLFLGVHFIRLKTSLLRLFAGVMIFEVAYFFGLTCFWAIPGLGAATGVANGGLMFQFMPLFPLWGPALARWAKRRIEAGPGQGTEIVFPDEPVAKPTDWAWGGVHFVVVFVLVSLVTSMLSIHLYPGLTWMVPLNVGVPLLLGVADALASVRAIRKRRRNRLERRKAERLRAGLCPRCEYSLAGNVSGTCPECGLAVAGRGSTQKSEGALT